MSSPASSSSASTVPTAVWFSAAPNVASEVNAGAAFGSSLSVMVPVAVASEISAFLGFDSVTVKVSFGSSVGSSVVDTVIVPVVSPAAMVSVSLAAVKSVPEVAVSPVLTDVAQSTITSLPLAGNRRTVNSRASPSNAEASSTLTDGSGSLSRIVILPVEESGASIAFLGCDSVTVKVSLSSSSASSATTSCIVKSSSNPVPGLKVTDPVAADRSTKSASSAVSSGFIEAVQTIVTTFSLSAEIVNLGLIVPCSTAVASPMDTVGILSSSLIVPSAVVVAASASFALTDTVTVKVSSSSSLVSSAVTTVNVAVIWPSMIVSVPVAADRSTKSASSAVSPISIDAVQVAVKFSLAASDSVTVKVTFPPSSPEASSTLSVGRSLVLAVEASDQAPVPSSFVARTCTS